MLSNMHMHTAAHMHIHTRLSVHTNCGNSQCRSNVDINTYIQLIHKSHTQVYMDWRTIQLMDVTPDPPLSDPNPTPFAPPYNDVLYIQFVLSKGPHWAFNWTARICLGHVAEEHACTIVIHQSYIMYMVHSKTAKYDAKCKLWWRRRTMKASKAYKK